MDNWPKAHVDKIGELRPGEDALVVFQLIVPLLRHPRHVIGGKPDFLLLQHSLPTKKLFTTIKPQKRVFVVVKSWEGQAVVSRGTMVIISLFICRRGLPALHLADADLGEVGLLNLDDDCIVRRLLCLDVANLGHHGVQLLEEVVQGLGISHRKGGG